jgi:hypothetical protein
VAAPLASLDNPHAKLARADEHLAELHSEAVAFGERDPYTITDEIRADRVHVARLRVTEYPPARLGLLFGEILGNWRSALDLLAYQLIRLGGRVPGERENTGFPIFDNERGFKKAGVKRIRGVRNEHAAIIESLQPYPGRQDPTARALGVLRTYRNADEHRAIHPSLGVFASAEEFAGSLRREPIDNEFRLEIDPVGIGRPLKDGMEIAHIRLLDKLPDPQPKLKADPAVEIAFGQPPLRLKALPALRRHIHITVERFATDFPA